MSQTTPPPALGIPISLLHRHCVELETEAEQKGKHRDYLVAHFRFSEAERVSIEIEGILNRKGLYEHLCRSYAVPLDPTWTPEDM